MERIQMTTEQAWEFIHDMNLDSDGTGTAFFYGLKQAGYIHKDIVEEAEEEYLRVRRTYMGEKVEIMWRLSFLQHQAIQYLKERQMK